MKHSSLQHSLFQALAADVCLIFTLSLPNLAHAHGFAGDYFFPATLTTDDPFAADEMSLPTFSTIKADGVRTTQLSWDITKTITPNFGIGVGQTLVNVQTPGQRQQTGVDNLEIGAIYQCYVNAPHQFIFSIGFKGEIGSTGSQQIGNSPFSTWTPTLYFGKGFGDLPDSVWLLKPLGITGTAGVSLPTSTSTPDALELGLAVEYSIIYLQEHVHDFGIRGPLSRMIPLVEVAFESPFNQGQGGLITGTINPGIIWSGKYFQVGAEAIIPMNSRTGNQVGVIAQLHFYMDDLLPNIFRPIFGGN